MDLTKYDGHTKGPWRLVDGANSHCFDSIVINKKGSCIAFVNKDDQNARLITDAPLLLNECRRLQAENVRFREALTEIATELVCQCEPCWTDRGLHEPECQAWAGDVARAALTKLNPDILS